MIIDNLKSGRYVLEEGVVSTLTPFTRIEDIEKELKKEIEANMKDEINKEIVVRELGRVIGFITENNWKVFFPTKTANRIVIAAPFSGGKMMHKVKSREINETTKKDETIEKIKDEVYIPCGYLTIDIEMQNFPKIDRSVYRIIPNLKDKTARYIYANCEGELFRGVHPHNNGHELCSGLQHPSKFDIGYIIELLRAGIIGSQKEASSIWDYNEGSPMQRMEECLNGKLALDLYKKGFSDQEIWNRIIKTERGDSGD